MNDPLLDWRFDAIRTVPDIVRYWAKRRPDKVALIEGDAQLTYAQLDAASDRLAHRLTELGISTGATVGYLGKNSIDFWKIWFAANKAGGTMAPFNWRCTIEELVAIIGDAAPPAIFTRAEFVPTLEAVRSRLGSGFEIVACDADGLDRWAGLATDAAGLPCPGPNDVALLSYTSGTTGVPKGVEATHEAFAYSFLCGVLEPDMAFRAGDVMLMSMPNFHLGGSWVSLAALYHGQTLSLIPAFDAQACLAAMRRDGVTIAPLVPAAIQLLLDQPGVGPEAFGALRSVIYFGSPIGAGLMARAVATMGCNLSQYYGTTETWFLTILRHAHHVDDGSGRLASCGLPLPLVSIRIDDSRGGEARPGEIGEVLARTPMMLAGYRNRPDATAEVLRDGWYRTGDLGRKDDAGYLYIVDRAKDMVISGGENIYSTEVEQALSKLGGVRMCAVVGLPDPKWGERVVAAIIADPAAGLTEERVTAHCRSLIAGYKTPKQVLFVDALPLTPTGKVRKSALREQLTVKS